jgi:hypothetical protein
MENTKYINSVLNSFHKYYDKDDLYFSTRKDKKFMVKNPNNNKWIHFGSPMYDDWHSHKDQIRLNNFKLRNKKWATANKYTPAHLSYWVLWN